MAYQYGTRLAPIAAAVKRALGPNTTDFPVVGNGLGGLPVRKDDFFAKSWIGMTSAKDFSLYTQLNAATSLDGKIFSVGYVLEKAFFQVTDSSGNIRFAKLFSAPTGAASFYGISAGTNGDLICCGEANGRAVVLKIDQSGNIKWQKYYGPAASNYQFRDVACSSSGDIYLVTSTYTTAWGAVLVKMNGNGVVQWKKRLSDTDWWVYGNSVCIDAAGNICVMCHSARRVSPWNENTVLVKINKDDGGLLNQNAFRGPTGQNLTALYQKKIYTDGTSFYFIADVYATSVVFVKVSSSLATTFVKNINIASGWPLANGLTGFSDGSGSTILRSSADGDFVLNFSANGVVESGTRIAVTGTRLEGIRQLEQSSIAVLGGYVDDSGTRKATAIVIEKTNNNGNYGDFSLSSDMSFVTVSAGSLTTATGHFLSDDSANTDSISDIAASDIAYSYSKIKIA